MPQPKRWSIAESSPLAAELAAQLKVSPLLSQILLNRGMQQPKDCQDFLRPSLLGLHEPSLLGGLDRAAERIAKAIADKQKIAQLENTLLVRLQTPRLQGIYLSPPEPFDYDDFAGFSVADFDGIDEALVQGSAASAFVA